MVKIDRKDRVLLFELQRNCRQPLSMLAKAAGISKQVAQYRINRLVRIGVLGRPILAIDAGRLGYQNYGVYFQWEDDSRKDAFLEQIMEDPMIRYAAECSGRMDFVVSFLAKTPTEFQHRWDRYITKFGTAIRRHSTHISTENRAFEKSYLIGKERRGGREIFLGSEIKSAAIDETDRKILSALIQDCRATIVSLAMKCGLSPETVKSRIKKMEGEGLIQGYIWVVNLHMLGYSIYELLLSLRNMDSRRWDDLRSYSADNQNITYFIRGLGEFEADVIFEASSERQFEAELHKIRNLFSKNISDFEIVKIVKEHQFRYVPLL